MRARSLSRRASRRNFNKGRKTRLINTPRMSPRTGIRL